MSIETGPLGHTLDTRRLFVSECPGGFTRDENTVLWDALQSADLEREWGSLAPRRVGNLVFNGLRKAVHL